MSLPLPPRQAATFGASCCFWVVFEVKPKYSLASVNLQVSTGLVTARFFQFLSLSLSKYTQHVFMYTYTIVCVYVHVYVYISVYTRVHSG